jgi:serine/threonine-protein kinase
VAIEPGTQLLHYRIVDKIGEGGMGVVWKAVDTELGREVAIKVLPEALAAEAERLARFEREARLLASLNHPCIAAVYGLHESDGMRFLAMELVQGEDLSVRLSRGRLPVEDALQFGRQVCEAFEVAHDAGVVHRDLKPANVMVTPDDKIKVLDFGLAKALAPSEAASGSEGGLSMSPTMTSAGTQIGMILGTAAYMSPEQARGKQVDRRADIWAFGCLLFEMLTGSVAFAGDTVTDTLAAVVRADPDWDALPSRTPVAVRRMLRRALEKDPGRRLRDAGDLRLEIDDALAGTDEPAATAGPPAPPSTAASRWRGVAWAIGGALLATLVLVAAWSWLTPASGETAGSVRFEVEGATGAAFIDPWTLALSPDGRRIVWVVVDGAHREIWLRDIDALETRPLPDTDGAFDPVFSPDGRSIAFFAKGKLRRLDLGDRHAIDLCDSLNGAGISWGRDGTLVYNDGWISALSRVSAEGGTPEPATRLDEQYGEIGHWFPDLLPDGKHVLVSRWRTGLNDMTVAVASLDTGEIRDLLPRASYARYVPTGHLLFTRGGAIHAVPFDAYGVSVSGDPVMLVDGVEQQWDNGNSTWTVSTTGALAYLPGSLWATKRAVARVSREGEITPLDVAPGAYVQAQISPDGTRLATTKFENGRTNVMIHDLNRGIETPVPLDAVNTYPIWSPDGREIVFDSAIKGPWDIYRFGVVDGSRPEVLLEDSNDKVPLAWSPDGRFLLWQDREEVRFMDLEGDRKPTALLPDADGASISPDSRWVAFGTAVSGQKEVLVRSFPAGTRDYQVSIDGGDYPLWSRDGRELLYRRGDAVLAVSIRVSADELVAGRPRELFRGEFVEPARHHWSYDSTTDELIMISRGEHEVSRDRLVVVLDWPAELDRRAE